MGLVIGFGSPSIAYAQEMRTDATQIEGAGVPLGDVGRALDDELAVTQPVIARVTEGTYAINANGLQNLRSAVAEATTDLGVGVPAVASTRVTMTPRVGTEQLGSSCGIAAASIDLETLVTLPEWRQFQYASAAEKAAWMRYVETLRAHENLHVSIAEEWATRLLRTIVSLPRQETCADVRAEVDAALERVLERHNAAQLALDARVRETLAAR